MRVRLGVLAVRLRRVGMMLSEMHQILVVKAFVLFDRNEIALSAMNCLLLSSRSSALLLVALAMTGLL